MYFYSGQGGFVVRLTYLLLTFFFHLAIFLVALVGLAHYWLPMVDDYKGVLEKELSDFVGNQVSIGQIRVDRDSEEPRWIIENLQLTEPDEYAPIHIQQLALTLDWRESLRTLRLQPAEIQLEGVEFVLSQQPDELPKVRGLTFPLPGQKNTALNIERKAPIRISINGGYVHWMDNTNGRTLTLSDLQFMGEILPNEITLQADALFPPTIGETLAVDAVMRRTELSDGEAEWGGKLHTRTRIFNLAALPSPQLQQYGVNAGSLALDANITATPGKPLHISGEGEITHLGWQGNSDIPALSGVNAAFTADNDGGKVEVSIDDSKLDYPQWFEKTLLIDHLTSDLQWTVQDDGWRWQITHLQLQNPDLKAEGSGKLDMLLGKPPDLGFNMQFATRKVVNNVREYIPSIVDDNTEKWLKTAIIAGYVPRGEFSFRGDPADYPFKHSAGAFDIRFDVERGTLAYLPDWPQAEDVSGELRFHNEGMSAKVRNARIMQLAVKGGTVDIPNMLKNARLQLELDTQGDLQAHMDYLRDSPLGKNMRDFMQVAEFSGMSELDLKMDVPLTQEILEREGVEVDGVVTLHDGRFAVPEYNQVFSKLNGAVHFDQYGVSAPKASGEYRQQPVTITAATDRGKNLISVNLQQQNDPAAFLPETMQFLNAYLQGKADIETRLELPSFATKETGTPSTLKIQAKSRLQGVAIHLPPPLAKAAGDRRDLMVEVELPFDSAKSWDINASMGKLLGVKARLPHKGKQQAAVGISLGEGEPVLPATGIQLGGKIADIDLLALQGFSAAGGASTQEASDPLPVKVDVSIANLKLGEQSLGKATLTAEGGDIIQAHVRAEKAQANLHLPVKAASTGRVNIDLSGIDLDRLSQETPGKGKAGNLSPKDFPSMRFTCRDCRKGDFPIQQLTLSMNKARNDLQIETLEIRNPLLAFSANQGRWYEDDNGNSHTELLASAHISAPGKLLAEQGSESGLQGGELTATASLNWAGAPFSFSLPNLNGEVQARLGKGSLSEVELGLGRLLGLLDLQRLPGRLSMDFRDMTGKGVAFDEISGTFRLDRGILRTDDTIVKAAIMVAGIQGSTDLVRKMHDQTVTVIPNLKSALPLVGVAVGGLGGGAAMLLFNSVTEKSVEDKLKTSGGFRYHVTGSWSKPDIAEINTSVRKD
ncbi:MAG: hypothetical protein KJ914_06870 [Gammaproteobacteria bacterium]|nr:hypothetical protein [Gammaproteobacteria bacterium]MBU1725168.1 hypothetical protein [Gammaproteobacteria bacterium]MBU2005138.1 hypothetical protein [Gammaproteobacteria bacterium]